MKAIQYYGPQNIKYEEVMVKPPEEGEVVVKVISALTCGTDVKTFRRGHPVLIKSILVKLSLLKLSLLKSVYPITF